MSDIDLLLNQIKKLDVLNICLGLRLCMITEQRYGENALFEFFSSSKSPEENGEPLLHPEISTYLKFVFTNFRFADLKLDQLDDEISKVIQRW
jgi:hypothetical protein